MVLKKSENIIEIISSLLQKDSIVIIPCDTIYGFVCATPIGEKRIRLIKGRDADKPFIQLIKNSDTLQTISSDKLDNALLAFWNKNSDADALTLIVNTKNSGTAALRVPNDAFLLKLLDLIDVPIVSTSVNKSGMKPINRIADIIKEFENSVDLIVDGGDILSGMPSTILDVTKKPYKILRQGSCIIPNKILK